MMTSVSLGKMSATELCLDAIDILEKASTMNEVVLVMAKSWLCVCHAAAGMMNDKDLLSVVLDIEKLASRFEICFFLF